MGKLLFDSRPLVIPTELANKVGLNEAIVLQQVHYWTVINEKAGKNFVDGAYWVYHTVEEWQEEFSFWGKRTVERIIAKLEKEDLLISANHNASKVDRTKWYRINYEKLQEIENPQPRHDDQIDPDTCKTPETPEIAPFRQSGGMHPATHANSENAPVYQNDKMHFVTNANPGTPETPPFRQNGGMDSVKVTECNSSKWRNASRQSDHINTRDYIKDYSKKTNNNNSVTIDRSTRAQEWDVVVSASRSQERGATPATEIDSLVAMYSGITGLDDLSPRFLSNLMRDEGVGYEYIHEKLLMLDSPEIKVPLPWLVAAIKNDWRPAQQKQNKADKPSGGKANPSCPDCHGAGWRIVTDNDAEYPREHAEPCPCVTVPSPGLCN